MHTHTLVQTGRTGRGKGPKERESEGEGRTERGMEPRQSNMRPEIGFQRERRGAEERKSGALITEQR